MTAMQAVGLSGLGCPAACRPSACSAGPAWHTGSTH